MKTKVRFVQSVNFKIALTFILILLLLIEIIGAYFIRGLERSTINNFIMDMNTKASNVAYMVSSELSKQDDTDTTTTNASIQRFLENDNNSEIIEMRVVDEKGILRATTNVNDQSAIGKRNDYRDMDDFTVKSFVTVDSTTGNRVQINVQPIQSPTGDAVIGALYIKSNLEKEYAQINDIAVIFISASLIAACISMIIALFVARSITQPIGEMRQQALRIARGDYSSLRNDFFHLLYTMPSSFLNEILVRMRS